MSGRKRKGAAMAVARRNVELRALGWTTPELVESVKTTSIISVPSKCNCVKTIIVKDSVVMGNVG